MSAPRRLLGSVATRYLLREFVGYLAPVLAGFVILYLIVDFFDRLDVLIKHDAPTGAVIRYFVLKIPLVITQILPPAALAATLLALGLLSRRNELVALRASGVSLLQTAVPVLVLTAAISVAALVWNETVVPYCTRQYQYVNFVEIRKRPQRAILSDRAIWYRGSQGFYNIEFVDPQRAMLFGLTIYRTTPAFALESVVEVPSAQWTGSGWVYTGAVERSLDVSGNVVERPLDANHVLLDESLADFTEVRRDPDELSYLALRQWVRELSRKGIDAATYLVPLNLKLAVPFTTVVLAGVAIPIAGRVRRHPSIAAIFGTGLALGFCYWVVLALTSSLGQNGVLPPVVAAWSGNAIFALIAVALFLSAE